MTRQNKEQEDRRGQEDGGQAQCARGFDERKNGRMLTVTPRV